MSIGYIIAIIVIGFICIAMTMFFTLGLYLAQGDIPIHIYTYPFIPLLIGASLIYFVMRIASE